MRLRPCAESPGTRGRAGQSADGRTAGRTRRLAALLAVAFVTGAAAGPRPARAVPDCPARPTGAGALLLEAGPGASAPRISSQIETRITGVIARTRVVQRFRNPGDEWLDAVYAFPLPDGAAVDGLRIRAGERTIEGRIEERRAARMRFERARDAGQRAALLEQDRTNWFRTAISAVEPRSEVEVTIEYQELLVPESDGLRWRLPLAAPAHEAAATADATAPLPNDPQAGPDSSPLGEPEIGIRIDLEPGFPLASLESPTHTLDRQETVDGGVRLTAVVRGHRDLELAWSWRRSERPIWRLLAETTDEGDAAVLLMLLPPADEAVAALRTPRDLVLAIDTSGSMAGAPIRHARLAVATALERLAPDDRFELVAFDERAWPLFGEARAATRSNLERARRFVDGLEASGGTDIASALDAVLPSDPDVPGDERVRQVVFVSDGAAPDEAALLERLRRRLGTTRFHAVAIGSAPNGAFMRAAARLGRGSVTFISARSEVGDRMARLFEKLESPVTTDLEVFFRDRVEMWPPELPDLHAGEPVVATALLPRLEGEVLVRGRMDGRPVEWRLPVVPASEARGIARLFARHKIRALTDSLAEGASRAEVDRQVLATAMRHGIVSDRTSLVAVEVSPRRPPSAPNRRAASRAPAPDGADPGVEMVGVLPAGATAGPLWIRLGLALLACASAGGALLARDRSRC